MTFQRLGTTYEDVKNAVTTRSGTLYKSRPKGANGLEYYVWRVARFHSGADTSMPVMAAHDLQQYLNENGIDAEVSGIVNDAGEQLFEGLEDEVDRLLEDLDLGKYGAARAWSGLV